MNAIGIFGGTFDPIHFGHLRMAQELLQHLNLSEVRFIPAAMPALRNQPATSAQHRSAMVRLAIADNPQFSLDERELQRAGFSYTIDTLTALRQELGANVALCLLLGSDAFLKLPSWQRWDALLSHAHIIVAHRPGAEPLAENMSAPLKAFYERHVTNSKLDIAKKKAGHILLQRITPLDISATAIRTDLQQQRSPRYLLPDAVIDYLTTNQLYTN
ncbi:MAG: nicotinate-nucleotide adenylyltransferase [Methylophilaceae bacterium]|nr:nicotinate-nucleotide adenylyltransferase [Methylophilaceae bacterium]